MCWEHINNVVLMQIRKDFSEDLTIVFWKRKKHRCHFKSAARWGWEEKSSATTKGASATLSFNTHSYIFPWASLSDTHIYISCEHPHTVSISTLHGKHHHPHNLICHSSIIQHNWFYPDKSIDTYFFLNRWQVFLALRMTRNIIRFKENNSHAAVFFLFVFGFVPNVTIAVSTGRRRFVINWRAHISHVPGETAKTQEKAALAVTSSKITP